MRHLAEVVVHRHAACRRPAASGSRAAAACPAPAAGCSAGRSATRVGQRRRARRRTAPPSAPAVLKYCSRAEALDAPRVGQRLALGDAHARLVRLEVVGLEELHRVRGHHRQAAAAAASGTAARTWASCVGQAGALQLDVEAPREQRRPGAAPRPAARARVAGQQRHADRAQVGARQRDQPVAQLVQPVPLDPGLGALRVAASSRAPAARTGSGSPACSAPAAAAGWAACRCAVGLHPQVDADDRLDALAAAGLVELDRAEQVGQVGDGQRHLAVGARRGGRRRRCAGCRRRRRTRCGCAGGRRPCGHCRQRDCADGS